MEAGGTEIHTHTKRERGREKLCACYNVSEKDADINTYTDGQINQFQAPLDSYGFSARHTFLSLSHCFAAFLFHFHKKTKTEIELVV